MNEEQIQLFKEGINLIFDKWTSCRLAVENNWGGMNSKEKKKILVDAVSDFVIKNSKSQAMLDDFLCDKMSSLFNTVIEDESEMEVTDLIFELYQDIKKNKREIFERIEQIETYDISQSKQQDMVVEVDIDNDEESLTEFSEHEEEHNE